MLLRNSKERMAEKQSANKNYKNKIRIYQFKYPETDERLANTDLF